ncbi:hypothetical protein ACTJJ8_10995 [Agrobacterium radiobacter]|jgi:hypothetical protein|uniref:Apea-like HEPN domain-containing protein n=1 Tax=Agrobacterium tumefaciens TaxID=358 RepID=A0AAW8LKH8_AGRTU|nr:hypothetical protein [Agrobacterium tumefaciens]MBP2566975.1 hypothetical protein [Agrobacterium tumefaciens]MDR6700565.1 hypothetical protein [Agrobacterium tumefaciens]QNP78761.1 hypothetical protein IAI05_09430 [Agrobacterium tumefaciens]TCV53037.1 hypothetical protein EDB97_103253 [Agrobacterium tumefaciens]
MGKVGYDSLEGILRVTALGEKQPDQFTADVLTYHAALELEMDNLLSLQLPRADKLGDGKLGYTHKIAVLNASWRGNPEDGDKLANALVRFNNLRNSVAHSDRPKEIRGHLTKLRAATDALDGDGDGSATPYRLAVRICAFMGDDPSAKAALKFISQVDDLVNFKLPAALEKALFNEPKAET